MKLYGSKTSPFVRRIRIALHGKKFSFHEINVYDKNDKMLLANFSPAAKVPVLVDGETVLWDSTVILKYLFKNNWTLEDDLWMALLNEASDTGVLLFQLKKFQVDPNLETDFSKNLSARLERMLTYIDSNFKSYSFLHREISLFCLLDWLQFREVFHWENKFINLKNFFHQHWAREEILTTDPR